MTTFNCFILSCIHIIETKQYILYPQRIVLLNDLSTIFFSIENLHIFTIKNVFNLPTITLLLSIR